MKKDIYIIKNAVNDMCYVGQSVDYLYRFRKHKEAAKRNDYNYKSKLYDAMNAIGIDKFYVEPLETQVDNHDEREIYWIKFLNTLYPNGYNLVDGGMRYPNLSGVLHHNAKITSQEDLDSIYNELINGHESLSEIAKHYGVEYDIVENINKGNTYKMDNVEYPLRLFTISKNILDRITYDLKYSNYRYAKLGEIYGLSTNQIKAINSGRCWKREYLKYPIRRMVFSDCHNEHELIQKELLSTSKSFDEIASEFNCSISTIIRINNGESYYNGKLQYPLQKRKLSSADIDDIHRYLLNTNLSINTIAKKYNVSDATIKRINNGATKKYRNKKLQYPLRPIIKPVSTTCV